MEGPLPPLNSSEPERKPGLVPRAGRFLLRLVREIVETVLPALLIALLINLFLAQATVVEGQSMEPTLHDHERVIVEKVSYRLHPPRRGDVVVLRNPGGEGLLIKRVVALPGEEVAVQEGHVIIDGRPLEEPWSVQVGGADLPPTTVPPDHVFVLGDNRPHSNDSRTFGPVPIDQIVGRAWLIYWPLDQVGRVD
ncbi:MAG TPA: signal peptidase I [Thermoflexia bacterium]|jgi:signal peptidase I|nr:signal peptidase I [Thermoflexia bacterium]